MIGAHTRFFRCSEISRVVGRFSKRSIWAIAVLKSAAAASEPVTPTKLMFDAAI